MDNNVNPAHVAAYVAGEIQARGYVGEPVIDDYGFVKIDIMSPASWPVQVPNRLWETVKRGLDMVGLEIHYEVHSPGIEIRERMR